MTAPATTPRRIQRQRTKGWRMPAGALFCGRPTVHGNPWPVHRLALVLAEACDFAGNYHHPLWDLLMLPARAANRGRVDMIEPLARALAVELFRAAALRFRAVDPAGFEAWIAPLRGRDLACYCGLDEACHVDVLLEMAADGPPTLAARASEGEP